MISEIKRRDGSIIATDDEGNNLIGLCQQHSADLRCANLRDADLRGADLRGASLRDAFINWNSHCLLAEILRQEASGCIQRLSIAGLVSISTELCWNNYLALDLPERDWALDVLSVYVRDNDGAPTVLQERAAMRTEKKD